MTKFQKDNFQYSGGFLTYNDKFVARFKNRAGDKVGFMSFLIKNFSVDEYFAKYAAGTTPAEILESKGYVSTTVKKLLKSAGYPTTFEGKQRYVKDTIAKYTTPA